MATAAAAAAAAAAMAAAVASASLRRWCRQLYAGCGCGGTCSAPVFFFSRRDVFVHLVFFF